MNALVYEFVFFYFISFISLLVIKHFLVSIFRAVVKVILQMILIHTPPPSILVGTNNWYQSLDPNNRKPHSLREDETTTIKYKQLYKEALDTIEDMKNKLKESLVKRKKLVKKLSESHEIIEKMEEQSGSNGLE